MRRRAVVGTPGLVWGFCVTPADVADCKGARAAVREAHSAYRGLIAFARVLFDLTVEVVTRREGRWASRSSRGGGWWSGRSGD